MKSFPLLTVATLVFLCSFSASAQYVPSDSSETKPYVFIETLNGEEIEGFLLDQNSKELTIFTEQGKAIKVKTSDVLRMEYDREEKPRFAEEYKYKVHASRYFFGPNALNIKRGEGYYQNNFIFLNQVSVGLSDNFTIGLGTVPLFIFGFGAPTPVWITPKFSVPIVPGKMTVAAGGLFGTVIGNDFNNTFGLGYGSFTLGNHNRNINLSIGYGMADGDWSEAPTISIGGMAKLTKRFYLISENYLVFDTYIFSLGGRTVFRDLSLDYGFIYPLEFEGALPWLGITIPFKLNLQDN